MRKINDVLKILCGANAAVAMVNIFTGRYAMAAFNAVAAVFAWVSSRE